MSTRFVYINDISEVDPSNATIYDLNKRYIDATGNMYGLKYNQSSKKVEIIKLLRTSSQHAEKVRKRMIEQRRTEATINNRKEKEPEPERKTEDHPHINHNKATEETVENEDTSINSENMIIPDQFIADKLKTIETHQHRLEGFIHNIGSSNIVSRDDRDLTNRLDELLRNLEIDAIQKMDKATAYYRELTEYPRGIGFYTGRFDENAKNLIEEMYSDEKKMNYIVYYEMNETLVDLYRKTLLMLKDLLNFMEKLPQDHISKLNSADKQHYADSLTTLKNTVSEIRNINHELNNFTEFLHNKDNFI